MPNEPDTMLVVEEGIPGVRVIPLEQEVCMLGAAPRSLSEDSFLETKTATQ